MSESHAWKCRNGHTMGQVERNSHGVRILLLYRQAIFGSAVALISNEEVDVMAVVEGYVADVRCSLCEDIRTWIPGEEALEHLLKQARRRG